MSFGLTLILLLLSEKDAQIVVRVAHRWLCSRTRSQHCQGFFTAAEHGQGSAVIAVHISQEIARQRCAAQQVGKQRSATRGVSTLQRYHGRFVPLEAHTREMMWRNENFAGDETSLRARV